MSSFTLYLTGSVPSVARGSSRRENSRKVRFSSSTPRVPSSRSVSRSGFAQELSEMVDQSKRMRLDYLIQQAKDALKFAVKNGPVTFPCACIAGDVVILHLLHELRHCNFLTSVKLLQALSSRDNALQREYVESCQMYYANIL